jgi:DNA-binding transcriptional LysR family regulator
MDWDDVRVFLAVARAGQFLAASRQLGVDNATVARRISALEASLGARLLDRSTSGCVMTTAGERFLTASERIESEMLGARADVSEAGLAAAGVVRIGAPDGFGTLFLAGRLGHLADLHPGLTVQLVPMPRAFSLSKREADIAVTIDRPEAGRLAIRKLTDYTLHFYAARSYVDRAGAPTTLADLTAHRLVTYVQDLLFSADLNFMPDVFGPSFRRLECAGAVGQSEAVRAGAGIGILHDYHAAQDSTLVRLLPGTVFRRSYWLTTHLDGRDSLRIRTVSDFIAQAVEAEWGIFCEDRIP